jgi:hypothetical protein
MVDDFSRVIGSRHALVAGAIGGAIALGDSLLGPVLGPVAELGAAALTAWIGARAVCDFARANGVEKKHALKRASEATRDSHGKNLAHKTLEFACSAAAGDPRAARAAGAIAVHCVRAQASSLVAHVLVGWSPPLFGGTRVVAASRAAFHAATFVNAMEQSVRIEFLAAA